MIRANALSSSGVECVEEERRLWRHCSKRDTPLVLYTSVRAQAEGRKGMTKDLGQP